MATRLLVVARDPLARAGLAAILAADSRLAVVGQVDAGDDAAASMRVYRPDVVLYDAGWERSGALDNAGRFVEQDAPVLALVGDLDLGAELWSAGVHGVVERSANAAQVAAAVEAVAAGLRVIAPRFAPVAQRRSGGIEPPLEALTPREIDVLRLMADGLSNKLIARELRIAENTVKFHVNAILAKLGAQSRTDAVVRATRMGILLL